jgi:hypothetical protein
LGSVAWGDSWGDAWGVSWGVAASAPGGPTPAGGIGKKRRWALIDERLYHATDDEIQELLQAAPAVVEPVYVSRRVAKKIKAKQGVERIERVEVKPEWDDEDDIEVLLWH